MINARTRSDTPSRGATITMNGGVALWRFWVILFASACNSLVQQTVERTKHDAIPSLIMYMIPHRYPRCTMMLFSRLIAHPQRSPELDHSSRAKCPLVNTLVNTRDLCAASFSGGLCDGADISLVNTKP